MREVRPHDVSPSGPIEDSLLGRRRVVGLFFSLARRPRFLSAGGSGILISDVRLDVHITSFAVARPQKADGAGTGQLRGRPEPFTGKGATSLVVNQTDNESPANGRATTRAVGAADGTAPRTPSAWMMAPRSRSRSQSRSQSGSLQPSATGLLLPSAKEQVARKAIRAGKSVKRSHYGSTGSAVRR